MSVAQQVSLDLTSEAGADQAVRGRDVIESWVRFAFVGLPAGRSQTALKRWKTPAAMLEAAAGGNEAALLETPGITPVTVERLREVATADIGKALEAMERDNIRLLLQADDEYPIALRGIADPPPYLFIRGQALPRDEVGVAIVGTRHATEYGRGLAEKLSQDLARRGITIVSGLARGIDTAAHRGALQAGGRTFAVCGCGLDVAYPSENKALLLQAIENGAAFSEFAPTVHPESWHFPARNRVISGLSAGVIVVEAAERSGALITSDFAMEQGREVFAVPGNVHKAQSRGPHALIKQGATLIESADDVIAALNNRSLPFDNSVEARGMELAPPTATVRPDLSVTENRIYLALEVEPRHVDDVATAAGLSAAETNATLVLLELKGVARRLPGNVFARCV